MKKRKRKVGKSHYNVESKIRSALRKIWLFSPQRREALADARLRGLPLYKCAGCRKPFIKEQVHVDHVEACGKSHMGNFDVFIDRLFNGKLQILCAPCHDIKTKVDKTLMQ